MLAGGIKLTDTDPFPAVAWPIVGAPDGVAYCNAAGFVRDPLFDGVRVTGPMLVGAIVKVCAAEELLNVSTIGVLRPPPDGVIVIVPL